jgi:hypothetical protein
MFTAANNAICESTQILFLRLCICIGGKMKIQIQLHHNLSSQSINILENIFSSTTREYMKIRDDTQQISEIRKQAKLKCMFYEDACCHYQ